MLAKVCGLTDPRQVAWAVDLGYDAIGVVMHEPSKRFVGVDAALEIIRAAKGFIHTVAVGVTLEEVRPVMDAVDAVQVFECVDVENLWHATKDEPTCDHARKIVYDASRGLGVFAALPAWTVQYADDLIVAGGLRADNVVSVIRTAKPFGVDVSSGVEKDGVKNYELMKAFINEVRSCEQ